MAKVVKTQTLSQFKAEAGVSTLSVFTSKNDNQYACDKATGRFIGMLSKDFDKSKDVIVHHMVDEETGEAWLFICNGEPKVADYEM